MKLAIIATGLFRNFFKNTAFIEMLARCTTNYEFVYVFLVINSDIDEEIRKRLSELFESIGMVNQYKIIDFKPLCQSHVEDIEQKQTMSRYQEIRADYLANNHSSAKEFLEDPDMYTVYSKGGSIYNPENTTERIKWLELATIQAYQLKLGIQHMLDYEMNKDMHFDVVLRTRLDLEKYPDNFVPFVPPDDAPIIEKLTFGRENIKCAIQTKFGPDPQIQEMIDYLKQRPIVAPAIWSNEIPHNFGGMYLNNWRSLDQIRNQENASILYAINDMFYFAKHDVFVHLLDLYDEYALLEPDPEIVHYYAPEAQFLIYCFSHGISPLMYWAENHYPAYWI